MRKKIITMIITVLAYCAHMMLFAQAGDPVNQQSDFIGNILDRLVQERSRSSRDIFSDVLKQMAERQLKKAIISNDEQLLKALIAHGIIDAMNDQGQAMGYMLFACGVSHFAIIKLLMDAGIDINERERCYCNMPLIAAASARRVDLMHALAWHGAHVRGVLSPKWRAIPVNGLLFDRISALMLEAKKTECLRTQEIRLMLEQDWCIPKSISRLIAQMSNMQWYDCDTLDIPRPGYE